MKTAPLTLGTISTKIGEKNVVAKDVLKPEDYTFNCPVFDPELKNLIEFVGGPRELFVSWLKRSFEVEHANTVRRAIELATGNGKPGTKKSKVHDRYSKLGI